MAGREFSRILLIALSPIGDTLFATPAIRALRQRYPLAHITALVYPTNQDILSANPDIDELLVHPTRHPASHWPHLLTLFRTLRQRRFQLTVDFCGLTLFLSRVICGAPCRLSVPFPRWWWLLPGRGREWAMDHAVHHFLQTIEPLGIRVPSPRLRMALTGSDRAFAHRFLGTRGVGRDDPLVTIHPGGEGLAGKKRWPRESFAAAADAIVDRYAATILLLGGDDEIGLVRDVARHMHHCPINGAGRTSLRQTAALIERSRLFIGNDSSPLHMAAALGVPVLGIYGPSNPANFRPFGAPYVLLQKTPACWPCFYMAGCVPVWRRPGCGNQVCLHRTTPVEVAAAAGKLLAGSQPQTAHPFLEGAVRAIEGEVIPGDPIGPKQLDLQRLGAGARFPADHEP